MQLSASFRSSSANVSFSPLISGDGDATLLWRKEDKQEYTVSVPLLAGMGMQQPSAK